jgi:hypothetical protein
MQHTSVATIDALHYVSFVMKGHQKPTSNINPIIIIHISYLTLSSHRRDANSQYETTFKSNAVKVLVLIVGIVG